MADPIVAGRGWGPVVLGAHQRQVDAALGPPAYVLVLQGGEERSYTDPKQLELEYLRGPQGEYHEHDHREAGEPADPDANSYSADYLQAGIQVGYELFERRVISLTFFPPGAPSESGGAFVGFPGTTERGVGLDATEEQVRSAHGAPEAEERFERDDGPMLRMTYPGLVFTFLNGALHNVSIE